MVKKPWLKSVAFFRKWASNLELSISTKICTGGRRLGNGPEFALSRDRSKGESDGWRFARPDDGRLYHTIFMTEKEPEEQSTEFDYVHDLMEDFGLKESNTIGELLECLREAEFEDAE